MHEKTINTYEQKYQLFFQIGISWYFHQLGGKYYFVDFKYLREKNWLQNEIPERIVFSNTYLKASWPKIFDAMIYIKKTSPCEPVEERRYWW